MNHHHSKTHLIHLYNPPPRRFAQRGGHRITHTQTPFFLRRTTPTQRLIAGSGGKRHRRQRSVSSRQSRRCCRGAAGQRPACVPPGLPLVQGSWPARGGEGVDGGKRVNRKAKDVCCVTDQTKTRRPPKSYSLTHQPQPTAATHRLPSPAPNTDATKRVPWRATATATTWLA